jgi:hypothetical protein
MARLHSALVQPPTLVSLSSIVIPVIFAVCFTISADIIDSACDRDVAPQVVNLKKQTLKPGFHCIGSSRVETGRSQALWGSTELNLKPGFHFIGFKG